MRQVAKRHDKGTTKNEHLQTFSVFSVIRVLIPWIVVLSFLDCDTLSLLYCGAVFSFQSFLIVS